MSDNEFQGNKTMDLLARGWEWLRCMLAERPIQLTMYGLAALLLAISLTTSIVRTSENQHDITIIRSALCNDPQKHKDQAQDCQALFDRLLKNPTHQQVIRLRQIIKNGK